MPEAQRVKYLRCLRQYHKDRYWRRLWRQAIRSGRVLLRMGRSGSEASLPLPPGEGRGEGSYDRRAMLSDVTTIGPMGTTGPMGLMGFCCGNE